MTASPSPVTPALDICHSGGVEDLIDIDLDVLSFLFVRCDMLWLLNVILGQFLVLIEVHSLGPGITHLHFTLMFCIFLLSAGAQRCSSKDGSCVVCIISVQKGFLLHIDILLRSLRWRWRTRASDGHLAFLVLNFDLRDLDGKDAIGHFGTDASNINSSWITFGA